MTSGTETIALLERALDQTAQVIAVIPADQARLPTPCPAWDVEALVRHLIGQDLRNFMASARGERPDWQAPPDEFDEDWPAAFQGRAAQLREVWQAADIDHVIEMPGGHQTTLLTSADQQIAELATHSWDLVKATGQDADP